MQPYRIKQNTAGTIMYSEVAASRAVVQVSATEWNVELLMNAGYILALVYDTVAEANAALAIINPALLAGRTTQLGAAPAGAFAYAGP